MEGSPWQSLRTAIEPVSNDLPGFVCRRQEARLADGRIGRSSDRRPPRVILDALSEIEDWLMSAPVRKRRTKSGPRAPTAPRK